MHYQKALCEILKKVSIVFYFRWYQNAENKKNNKNEIPVEIF